MIKDLLVSFKENLNDKVKNPFLGTYLIVWLIRNWDLVYSLFNFEKATTLAEKINFIKGYYNEQSFIESLLINVLWAFALLITTYILLNLSRLIVNFSEKQITPWIIKITDSKSIVLKSTYDILKLERNNLETKLEKERDIKSKLQAEFLQLENKLEELKLTKDDPKNENKEVIKHIKIEPIELYLNKLESKKYSSAFLEFALNLEKGEWWIDRENEPEDAQYFFKIGLVELSNTDEQYILYSLTDVGRKVFNILRLK